MAKLGDKSDPVAQTAKNVARQIISAVPQSKQSSVLPELAERIKPGSKDWFAAQSKYGYELALAALIANSYSNMLMTGKVPDYVYTDINDGLGGIWDTVKKVTGASVIAEVLMPGTGLISGAVVGGTAAITAATVGAAKSDFMSNLLGTVASGAKTVACTDGSGTILGGLIGGIAALYTGGAATAAVPAGAAVGTAGQGAIKPVLGCSSGKPAQSAAVQAPVATFPYKPVILGGVGLVGVLALVWLLAAGGKQK